VELLTTKVGSVRRSQLLLTALCALLVAELATLLRIAFNEDLEVKPSLELGYKLLLKIMKNIF
jgi:hypothetical protein